MEKTDESAFNRSKASASYEESELLDNMSMEGFTLKSCLRFVSDTKPKRQSFRNKPDLPLKGPPLPEGLWMVIAKVLGIRLSQDDKPWLATLLYVMTWVSAVSFILSRSCYIAYDLAADNTSLTELKFTFAILLKICWGILAIYANSLAYRMFTHQSFVKNIRLHSKTLLKCNIACLIIATGFIFTLLSIYDNFEESQPSTCESVGLPIWVCKFMYISRIIFSLFAYFWHTLIALVLVSVCRTQTLNIRHFKKELEQDALSHNEFHARTSSASTGLTNVPYFTNDIEIEDDIDGQSSSETDDKQGDRRIQLYEIESHSSSALNSPDDSSKNIMEYLSKQRNLSRNLTELNTAYLSTSEILRRYWKLQRCLYLSSSAFKRWLVSCICLCLVWVGTSLVSWLTCPPSIIEVILFLVPLVWLPTISSAIAEVNNEGQRVLRFVYPLEERMRMLLYFNQAPLQISVYGYGITYSTMVTSLFGLVAALLTGVLMQEIKKL